MTTKHTAGPWNCNRASAAGRNIIVSETAPLDIAVLSNRDKTQAEIDANSRLIASAPTMLKTLQRAAYLLAELPNQTPQMLALRSEIVAAISDAAPEYYGLN